MAARIVINIVARVYFASQPFGRVQSVGVKKFVVTYVVRRWGSCSDVLDGGAV